MLSNVEKRRAIGIAAYPYVVLWLRYSQRGLWERQPQLSWDELQLFQPKERFKDFVYLFNFSDVSSAGILTTIFI
jgi:hypothetical protein